MPADGRREVNSRLKC